MSGPLSQRCSPVGVGVGTSVVLHSSPGTLDGPVPDVVPPGAQDSYTPSPYRTLELWGRSVSTPLPGSYPG